MRYIVTSIYNTRWIPSYSDKLHQPNALGLFGNIHTDFTNYLNEGAGFSCQYMPLVIQSN